MTHYKCNFLDSNLCWINIGQHLANVYIVGLLLANVNPTKHAIWGVTFKGKYDQLYNMNINISLHVLSHFSLSELLSFGSLSKELIVQPLMNILSYDCLQMSP